MAKSKQEKTLEEAFGELEEIVGKLEQEPDSLEESFALYKKGMDLLKECHSSIDQVEKEMILLDEESEE